MGFGSGVLPSQRCWRYMGAPTLNNPTCQRISVTTRASVFEHAAGLLSHLIPSRTLGPNPNELGVKCTRLLINL